MAEAQKGQEKVKDSPQGESSSPPLVGNTDTRISNHRKCWRNTPTCVGKTAARKMTS